MVTLKMALLDGHPIAQQEEQQSTLLIIAGTTGKKVQAFSLLIQMVMASSQTPY